MLKLFLSLLLLIFFGFTILALIDSRIGWTKLAKLYKTEQTKPESLVISNGEVTWDNVPINGLGIGATHEGLYLASLLNEILNPQFLIPWDDITYRKNIAEENNSNHIIIELGKPKISTLTLAPNIIKKIHDKSEESFFFNKLGISN